MQSVSSALASLLVALALGACAAKPQAPTEVRQGKIEEIIPVQIQSDHDAGIAAVAGAAVGLGAASLIAAGSTADVAMVIGLVGGPPPGMASPSTTIGRS